jgi:hypothetical protein
MPDHTISSVAEIAEFTALTLNQVARLLGVSIRTYHQMVEGLPPTDQQAVQLRLVLSALNRLTQTTPAQRKAALLASSKGPSLFAQLKDSAVQHQQLQYPLSVKEKLGI